MYFSLPPFTVPLLVDTEVEPWREDVLENKVASETNGIEQEKHKAFHGVKGQDRQRWRISVGIEGKAGWVG